MKKTLLWITALMTLVGCSQSNEEQMLDVSLSEEIKLCSEVCSMTRSNNLELQSTQIVPGQMLGVYIYNASHAMNNSPWLVGGEGSLTNQRSKIYWAKNNDINIVAYQPYMTDDELSKGTFTVKTDQSTDKMYQESDLLLATRTASKQTAPVPLTFYHKLSKIMVRIVADDAHFLDGAEVWVCGTKISTPFDPNECRISAIEPVSDIKAAVLTEEQLTAAAIVVPQTVGAGSKFIRVKVGDRMFFYRLKNDATFESGYSYLYTLHLSLDDEAIKLLSYQLIDWDEEGRESVYTDKHKDFSVDLGLPSGNIWATCDLGSESPEVEGGIVVGYDKDVTPTGIWEGWRLPSDEDWNELFRNCSLTKTTLNGVTVNCLTSNINSKTIFFKSNCYWSVNSYNYSWMAGSNPHVVNNGYGYYTNPIRYVRSK